MNYIAFDIGGTSTKWAIIDNSYNVLEKNYFSNKNKKRNDILIEISNIININNIDQICISSPACVDTETGNITGLSAIIDWNNFNIYEELKKLVNFDINIVVDNDANCALLAEIADGNAKGYDNVLAVVIGTGIGIGVMLNKKIIKGNNFLAGESARGIANYSEEDGKITSVTNYSSTSSTRALTEIYFSLSNQERDGEYIWTNLENDNNAMKALNIWINNLSVFIINIKYSFDPDIILLGGAVSKQKKLVEYLENNINKIKKITWWWFTFNKNWFM